MPTVASIGASSTFKPIGEQLENLRSVFSGSGRNPYNLANACLVQGQGMSCLDRYYQVPKFS
eukprot:SAG31_NODE_846_length_11539_cov_70.858392_1_plen_62_part_00